MPRAGDTRRRRLSPTAHATDLTWWHSGGNESPVHKQLAGRARVADGRELRVNPELRSCERPSPRRPLCRLAVLCHRPDVRIIPTAVLIVPPQPGSESLD